MRCALTLPAASPRPHLAAVDNPHWAEAGIACYEGGHLAQAVISGVLSVAFVALCALFSLVIYDSNSMSSNVVAKAHGRADFVFLCVKTVLVVTVETFPSDFTPGTLAALVVLGGLAWAASVAFFMPFFEHRWNRFHLAQATSFLYLACCLVLSELLPDADASPTVYLGLPLAAAAGVYAADWRARRVFETPTAQLANAYEVEQKARQVLHLAVWGHPTSRGRAALRAS